MSKEAPLRFGLIGCGRIAQSHIEALATLESGRLAAVVDVREGPARATAELHQASFATRYDDPKIADAIDAVIVCTPPNGHFAIATHFLDQGKHVLCEKPLTLTSTEARGLAQRAKDRGRALMMASKFRYVDDVIRAKALIEAGALGEVIQFENAFCGKVAMKERWNSQRATGGGGVLIDNGSHSVDISRYLFGPIRAVQAQLGRRGQELDVEDTVHLRLDMQVGAVGSVDLSWSISKELPNYLSAFGLEGTLHVGWQGSRYKQHGSPQWIEFGSGYDKLAAFRAQLANFVEVARGRAEPLIGVADAVASVAAIEAAYASLERDKWQGLEVLR